MMLVHGRMGEPKNAPELPIGRFLNSKSLGGNRVILVVPLVSAKIVSDAKTQTLPLLVTDR